MNKLFISTALAATLLLGASLGAQAAPAPGVAPTQDQSVRMIPEFSAEQQSKYDGVMKGFYDKVSPLTEKMMAKRLELDALSGNSNADPKRITALSEEIAALQTQMRKERIVLDETLNKELGSDFTATHGGGHRGFGKGHMGKRHGRGNGGYGFNHNMREHEMGRHNSSNCPMM